MHWEKVNVVTSFGYTTSPGFVKSDGSTDSAITAVEEHTKEVYVMST